MGTVTDLNEFRKKKEQEAEKEIAGDLYRLLSELMIDDEPIIVSMIDSDGTETVINLDDIVGLSDSNYTPF